MFPSFLVIAEIGGNVTLPCRGASDSSMFGSLRVKWMKVEKDESLNEDVLLSMGIHKKTYGSFEDRVFLQDSDGDDASLIITDISMDDMGRYRCEILDGVEDIIQDVILEVENGPALGKYTFLHCYFYNCQFENNNFWSCFWSYETTLELA